MSNQIDISVIIAAYNVAPYLERAVQSVLRQEGVSFEIIIIDDHSTDETFALAKAFTDPRIKVLQTPQNGGAGAARNIGLMAAQGKYAAVLDGDDAYDSGRLARMLSLATSTRAAITVDNITVCKEEDDSRFPMFDPLLFNALKTLNLETFIAERLTPDSRYTLGYLKPLFYLEFLRAHNLSYDTSLPIGEDYQIFVEILASGGTCAIDPAQGYLYTARKGSISHRQSAHSIELILQGDANFMGKYTLSPEARAAFTARTKLLQERLAFTHLVDAIKQKNIGKAIRAIASKPSCIRHLAEPISIRIQRLTKGKS